MSDSTDATFPPIETLLPQSGPMALLSQVTSHDDASTVCIALPDRAALFRSPEGVAPAWLGLELMAQCVAADGALRARARGEALGPALLLGARRLDLEVDAFGAGQRLLVRARHRAGSGKLAQFDCEVRDADTRARLASGRLSVYVPAGGELPLGDD